MTPAQQLLAAADHIERVGLYQDGGFFDPAQRSDLANAPCCVAGALIVVGGDAIRFGGDGSAYFPLNERLNQIPEIGAYAQDTGRNALVYWSDHTPQAEVLETLRRIAAELETAS